MSDPLIASTRSAASGLFAQSARMRVVSENIANASTTGKTPGADPYQRKTISFQSVMDENAGADLVQVDQISRDETPFETQYMPGNAAADSNGMVKMPNVNMMVELADMREASRSYTANTQVIKQVRELVSMTIDLMRST
ncbi:flagellar basal-body rod protein FlgC (cell-proximal rod protein) [Hyphomicrobium sp. GJ21]|jgi:flagellar basal-body rod protein FlgC|uniref:flagellar basal body rod protein FlgC n=1 Tax=Hyphomicrobium sp. GJ21 TaxID=113574 RepID=UPI000622BDD2|nr:flagellar basal body rod protein FlgC [Hyphomicrobium sp. GJ21]CEJ87358.1 flagellar basal-body rod protein FlgC (cell-proximal rod protein) [Hyphomicrobium sp. GJ21]